MNKDSFLLFTAGLLWYKNWLTSTISCCATPQTFKSIVLIYLSSVLKILRKATKIFQDLRIWIPWNRQKAGYITYLKIYIKIRVNTMDRGYTGRRMFNLSGNAQLFADSVISTESTWMMTLPNNLVLICWF